MTNTEFEVLDELYFLQSYQYLIKALGISDDTLKITLRSLLEKGWLKCYRSPTEEIEFKREAFEKEYWNYHYLATKAGLLVHNNSY